MCTETSPSQDLRIWIDISPQKQCGFQSIPTRMGKLLGNWIIIWCGFFRIQDTEIRTVHSRLHRCRFAWPKSHQTFVSKCSPRPTKLARFQTYQISTSSFKTRLSWLSICRIVYFPETFILFEIRCRPQSYDPIRFKIFTGEESICRSTSVPRIF